MPPHLHPRSRMTSSLFATTLVASFFVVALPHILPCPVPRTRYADGEVMIDDQGRRKVWRRREAGEGAVVHLDQTVGPSRSRRECPVPKPGGALGRWLASYKRDG
ncbi:hypothetical protein CDD80_6749 [Ophiocordyceps camponoti-rufipedis]|uniref:Uncharacterized protein n=1 Tax=Ophiocordyceps camponoti-rufipedis TaxID=2004952 RepID=A0A2C5YPG7_9HYPO|nr:hypothetical protein CDD80_6749 [Ophiocordyceps camponoti-rufipedis]